MSRITEDQLPLMAEPCIKKDCVYNDGHDAPGGSFAGMCDSPQINRGNSDAKCHKTTPRTVLKWLGMLT
jgi:hypothetical protein